MNRRRDPLPLSDVLNTVLSRLGMGDLSAWERIRGEWESVAPPPWNLQSKPLALTDGVLVVEAVTPAAVGLLRYGINSLERAMAERYGEGVVREVKLRAPKPHQRH